MTKKGYYPRCCDQPMESVWIPTGTVGRKGGKQMRMVKMECNVCNNTIR